MQQKWRVIGSKSLLKDRWIDLRADHCVTRAGFEIEPYYVLSYPDWVHVVAVTDAGELVLVRQYRHAANEFFLELPGGAADPNDPDFEQTARRELIEETGFTARDWKLVTSLYPNPATHTNRVHFFLALGAASSSSPRLDPGEEGLETELHAIRGILRGLPTGIIGPAMQVAGLLMCLAEVGVLSLGHSP